MFAKKQKIHFIGIGGIGMSGIARILISMGYKVSGSDLNESEITETLRSMGADIYKGHKEENVKDDVSVVVTSTAIPKTNPELLVASKRDIAIIHRGEMLAEIMRLRYGIAISGTHGKTTTSSLTSHILSGAGYSPTSVIGGKYFNINSNANLGESQYLVCEADESDGSFLKLMPVITVVTNIDNDHLDYYQTEEALRFAFLEFINKVPFYGSAFLCFENAILKDLSKDVTKRFYSYGFSKDFDLYAHNVKFSDEGASFTVTFLGDKIGDFKTPLLGEHNVLNALAAIGVAKVLEVDSKTLTSSLADFKGVGRRLNLLSDKNGIKVYDDYGHHPTEIMATLSAIRPLVKKRLIVAFQPHRYSRSEQLFEEFGKSFKEADVVIITDIYPAGEQAKPGISGETIYNEVLKNNKKEVYYVKDKSDLPAFFKGMAQKGDLVLTLGAGDIYKTGESFARAL